MKERKKCPFIARGWKYRKIASMKFFVILKQYKRVSFSRRKFVFPPTGYKRSDFVMLRCELKLVVLEFPARGT